MRGAPSKTGSELIWEGKKVFRTDGGTEHHSDDEDQREGAANGQTSSPQHDVRFRSMMEQNDDAPRGLEVDDDSDDEEENALPVHI
jgi:hypothetical protein